MLGTQYAQITDPLLSTIKLQGNENINATKNSIASLYSLNLTQLVSKFQFNLSIILFKHSDF